MLPVQESETVINCFIFNQMNLKICFKDIFGWSDSNRLFNLSN